MAWRVLAAAAAALTIGAAPEPQPAPAPAGPLAPPPGYLLGNSLDTYKILPPAPVAGTVRYEADRKTFLGTRYLKDSPRWALATADADQTTQLRPYACAIGVTLTVANAPATVRMLSRVGRDSSRLTNLPKDIYKRQRPYQIDEGPTCVEKTEGLGKSPDYPSGHTTYGWTLGLIMAELAPDRANEILQRAKAYGESRLVCGVHNLSAVESGRMNASIIVAGLHGVDEFRRDMDVARKEVAAARKAGGPAPDPAECLKLTELIAKSPY